nr:hypothetical protein [Dickeya dadantii]
MTTLTANFPASSRPPSLLIVQMGEPPEPIANAVGQQADWFGSALADEGVRLHVVRPDAGDALPNPGEHDAAIISGSWSMVTDRLDWSERPPTGCARVWMPGCRCWGCVTAISCWRMRWAARWRIIRTAGKWG